MGIRESTVADRTPCIVSKVVKIKDRLQFHSKSVQMNQQQQLGSNHTTH